MSILNVCELLPEEAGSEHRGTNYRPLVQAKQKPFSLKKTTAVTKSFCPCDSCVVPLLALSSLPPRSLGTLLQTKKSGWFRSSAGGASFSLLPFPLISFPHDSTTIALALSLSLSPLHLDERMRTNRRSLRRVPPKPGRLFFLFFFLVGLPANCSVTLRSLLLLLNRHYRSSTCTGSLSLVSLSLSPPFFLFLRLDARATLPTCHRPTYLNDGLIVFHILPPLFRLPFSLCALCCCCC